jgi:hypothetical protein
MARKADTARRLLIEATRIEAATLIREVAPLSRHMRTTKARIRSAAKRLGWTFGRAREIWKRAARRIDAHEMDQLRAMGQRSSSELPTTKRE